MEKFTKGKMKATKPLSSNGYWYVDLVSNKYPSGSMAVFYHANAEYDAKLFALSNEMYAMLDTIETVLSGNSEYNATEINVDYLRKLLAKARGE